MKRLYAALCTVESVLAATLLLAMVVLIFAGGVLRTMGNPINWSIDAATCAFAWACFFCADIAWRRNALMSIELVTDRLPPSWRRACAFLSYAIIVVFRVYVLVGGIYLSWIGRARSFQGIPWISYSWVTMSMPVGAVLLLITAFIKIREELAASRHDPADPFRPPATT